MFRTGGFRVGRLFGIDIRIDWSWLLIFALVTWNLATVFGGIHSDWSTALRWGVGVAASLLFFASVLAHEMAHSLVAQRQGMPVREITLFLFGGVSNIQRNPDTPRAEFLMAVVGPLTSIILGIIFVLLSGVNVGTATSQSPENTLRNLGIGQTLLLWLGPINIIVGVFNLIPGFPLDGGRLMRSVFWAITNNVRTATRYASWLGQGIAWLMILGGIAMVFGARIPFFGTGFINGLWLAFIGWFLNSAASQSYQQVVIQDVLEGVSVSEMMRRDPPTVPPNATVSDLVHEHVMGADDYGFPVMDQDRLIGVVTLDDVRSVPREQWQNRLVRDIMTPMDRLVTVTPDEDAEDALSKLQERDVRQLPVTENGHLVGLLRRRDIINWLRLHSDAVRGGGSGGWRPGGQSRQ
jgi:Zn-dependent protease/predicted transcriptional regulator